MPGGNEPGQIDVWIARELNVQDDPQKVVACAFVRFLTDIYSTYSFACEPDTKEEQWVPVIGAICEQWRNVLLGVKEPTVTEADILDRQDD